MMYPQDIALPFSVIYDVTDGFDYDESFRTLREAMARYNAITVAPGSPVCYKKLTVDSYEHGTRTLLTSHGDNNLEKYGLYPCDYR